MKVDTIIEEFISGATIDQIVRKYGISEDDAYDIFMEAEYKQLNY